MNKLMLIKCTICLCIPGVLISSCIKNFPDSAGLQKVYSVTIETCVDTNETVEIHSSGILTSKQISKLAFKSGGIVSRMYVDNGSFVKKGQVLASIDMTEMESRTKQADFALEKAERDLQRVKNLYSDTVATLEQLQNSTSAYNVALDNSTIARYNLQFSRIVAPTDGRIIAKLSEENELVSSGMPVFVFATHGKDEWIIKIGIADKDVTKMAAGTSASVVFDAYPDREFNAEVKSVAGVAEQSSGTFEIELQIDPDSMLFVNGLVANVTIHLNSGKRITMIPLTALVDVDGNNGHVFVVNSIDSTVKKVQVTIVSVHNTGVSILESLQKMGPIVTSGTLNLDDGSKVKIIK
jgi:membrane fusion protein, multidrug efflux system